MTQSFKEVLAWQKAHEFVLLTYKVCAIFPKHELFGLCSQFRRAAVSIAANIAEGYRRKGFNEKLHFLNIAQGSLEECRYYILLAHDLNYIDENTTLTLETSIEDASRLLNAYYRGLKDRNVL